MDIDDIKKLAKYTWMRTLSFLKIKKRNSEIILEMLDKQQVLEYYWRFMYMKETNNVYSSKSKYIARKTTLLENKLDALSLEQAKMEFIHDLYTPIPVSARITHRIPYISHQLKMFTERMFNEMESPTIVARKLIKCLMKMRLEHKYVNEIIKEAYPQIRNYQIMPTETYISEIKRKLLEYVKVYGWFSPHSLCSRVFISHLTPETGEWEEIATRISYYVAAFGKDFPNKTYPIFYLDFLNQYP